MFKVVMLFFMLLAATTMIKAADAAKGEVLFRKCVSCHGKDGYGKKSQKAPLIAGQYDWYVESQIMQIRDEKRVNKNTKKMYPFVKKLSDGEIGDLAAYISSMSKRK